MPLLVDSATVPRDERPVAVAVERIRVVGDEVVWVDEPGAAEVR